jgi:hypothetical protein
VVIFLASLSLSPTTSSSPLGRDIDYDLTLIGTGLDDHPFGMKTQKFMSRSKDGLPSSAVYTSE